MGLLDLFRPKWKHSNADVRVEAVRRLGPEDHAILLRIAQKDADVRVRRLALKKIDDPQVLAQIGDDDPDEGLRRVAAEKAQEVLLAQALGEGDDEARLAALSRLRGQKALGEVARRGPSAAVREAALTGLERLGDQKLLGDVARNAQDAGQRRRALLLLSDQAVLRDVAVLGPDKDAALQAIARISDEETLADIAQRGPTKAVRNAARARLPDKPHAPPSPPSPESQRRAQAQKLCRAVEVAEKIPDLSRAGAEIAVARAAWAELALRADDPAEADLVRRFERAAEVYERRRHEAVALQRARLEEEARRAQQKQREQQQSEALTARAALVERVEQLQGDDIPAGVDDARAAWQALGLVAAGERVGDVERRFTRACDAALRRHRDLSRHKAAHARLAAIVAEAEAQTGPDRAPMSEARFRDVERDWQQAAAIATPPGPGEELLARFARVREALLERRVQERARREEELLKNHARAESLCQHLEGGVQTQDRRRAAKVLKDAQAEWKRLGPLPRDKQGEARARFAAAREKLLIHLKDLDVAEDWKRWANVPRLEQLCQRVEALLEATDLPVVAKALRAVQGEWKQVGPAPKERSEALWQRFKAASDKVHERCREHFAVLDEARTESLQKKVALCERAEALMESTDFEGAAAELKKLQEEWKALGPAPREQGDQVWRRFRKACDHFFGRRKEALGLTLTDDQKAENLKKREALCEKAERLAESTDFKQAADLLKAYQAEWKEAGPAPRRQADELWKRFRAACDRFFERRKEHFAVLDEERAQNLQKKEELCVQVEALAESADEPEELQRKGRELLAQWKAVGPAPREQADAIWERFRTGLDRLREERREPEAVLPEPAPAEPGKPVSRFENRLPLAGIAERLGRGPGPLAPAAGEAAPEKAADEAAPTAPTASDSAPR